MQRARWDRQVATIRSEREQRGLFERGLARVAADRADPARARRRGLQAAAAVLGRTVADMERVTARFQRDDRQAVDETDLYIRARRRGIGWRTVVVPDNWTPSGSPAGGG
jgi:hypothetical protein